MTYQVLTCPNCGGKGCPTCQGTGKVRVSSEQLQKIKTLAKQVGVQSSPGLPASASPEAMRTGNVAANLSGILAFSLLAIIAGAGAASWYFLKTLKPFFAGLGAILILAGTRIAWNQPFFQLQEPDDFLKALKAK